ncbi:hypothetical protein [Jatrophihabitans sp.]|uniref:hypothetical protein n=1 Tax=Jatrophihabitans sp. TaxID=1932789 RepID=UPI0030C72639|nr:hypothetical protein [Jatrophihabitans sp.]
MAVTLASYPNHTRRHVAEHSHRAVSADVVVDDLRLEIRITVSGGHIAPGDREHLVEQIFAAPEVAHARVVRASIPAGDVELLDALRLRCGALRVRAAGSTCLVDGVLAPADPLTLKDHSDDSVDGARDDQ